MQLIADSMSIERKTFPWEFGKPFTNRYALKSDSYTFWSLLTKFKQSSKINTLIIKSFHNWISSHDPVR